MNFILIEKQFTQTNTSCLEAWTYAGLASLFLDVVALVILHLVGFERFEVTFFKIFSGQNTQAQEKGKTVYITSWKLLAG